MGSIKQKTGYCVECGNTEEKPIITNLCFYHYKKSKAKPIVRKPCKIKPVSDKRKSQDKVYSFLRKEFLENNSTCQANLDGCVRIATDVHHLYSGASRSKYYLFTPSWKAVCRECHHQIHDVLSKDKLIELRLKLIE